MSKTKSFLTIFKNGGPNYSFGRSCAGFTLVICLFALVLSIYSDYHHPTKPVLMQRFNQTTNTGYQETILVAEPNWIGYQTFMLGIAAITGAIYGITKGGEVITKRGDNNQIDPTVMSAQLPQTPQIPNTPETASIPEIPNQ